MLAVWSHFQGGSLCLTSVCCSVQCLISTLSRGEGGGGGHFFPGSLVRSRCGEGGMLQTNNTGVCSSVSAPLGLPLLVAHTTQALRCCTGNRLRPALGCMHLPDLSRSSLALREPSEAQIRLGLRFVPFPGPSSSGVWRAWSLRLITFPVSAVQFSGCTTGVPSQVDDDCPEPQEVLVSKEACFQFGR